jgi:hypothetical protein
MADASTIVESVVSGFANITDTNINAGYAALGIAHTASENTIAKSVVAANAAMGGDGANAENAAPATVFMAG